MQIRISTNAELDLAQIRDTTDKTHGAKQANAYIEFLSNGIDELATEYASGRTVEDYPELQRISLKWKRSKYSHIVVYEVDEEAETIDIHHVYHSSMDIASRLDKERASDHDD